MRVLITGANGMLGAELTDYCQQLGYTVIPTGRQPHLIQMDVTEPRTVRAVFEEYRPEVVFHCAAMTNVDACEQHPQQAYRVNAFGSEVIASQCHRVGAICVAISTDYVFDGKAGRPYHEYDTPNPLSVYGRSKWLGEQAVQALCPRHYIVRVAWLYGRFRPSFPQFVLQQAQAGEKVKAIVDQIGSPTYTYDVAQRLLQLVQTDAFGVYHLTNRGPVSRYEFARTLLQWAGLPELLEPIPMSAWQTPAPRPAYSALISWRLEWAQLPPMPTWRDALRRFLKQMGYTAPHDENAHPAHSDGNDADDDLHTNSD